MRKDSSEFRADGANEKRLLDDPDGPVAEPIRHVPESEWKEMVEQKNKLIEEKTQMQVRIAVNITLHFDLHFSTRIISWLWKRNSAN